MSVGFASERSYCFGAFFLFFAYYLQDMNPAATLCLEGGNTRRLGLMGMEFSQFIQSHFSLNRNEVRKMVKFLPM